MSVTADVENFIRQASASSGVSNKLSDGENASVQEFIRQASAASGFTHKFSDEDIVRQASAASGFSRKLSDDDIEFKRQVSELAKDVFHRLMSGGNQDDFDKLDGSDGLEPPTADVPDAHFKRRLLAKEVLAATEDFLIGVQWNMPGAAVKNDILEDEETVKRCRSCLALGYTGEHARTHPAVSKALDAAIDKRHLLLHAAAFGKFTSLSAIPHVGPPRAPSVEGTSLRKTRSCDALTAPATAVKRDGPAFHTEGSAQNPSTKRPSVLHDETKHLPNAQNPSTKRPSVLHDETKHLPENDDDDISRLKPPSEEKPVLKDPMGIQCVKHLRDPKWTKLARAIRESIYDPDFYDDGTYGPMYVRLAIHGAATWDRHDQTGGLEGAAMRFKPEYSDAHNKFCKEVVKRQHEVLKVPFPWASYADIQCLCSYVALECADGPVIPFTPGRRDIIPSKSLKEPAPELGDDDFVYLNYRERGDVGHEDEPARCPASGKTGECPFMLKKRVMPGRLPGPEQGHLGKFCEPVSPESERKELEEVAKEIRHIFVDRIGASEQHTVALIAGGHSLGRCHPQISGYAGPWQSNPGCFNNVYCKKLLSEDWKIVDRNMKDCSGDMVTGLKPYGMRRQYVNRGGRGDLMMLVSDMALKADPQFGHWIQHYALDGEALRRDFGAAFKWITELGFEPPEEKRGVAKLLFNFRKCRADSRRWIAETFYGKGDGDGAGDDAEPVVMAADAPRVGKPYTMAEVQEHASKEDCWVAINGKVCNLTEFMALHPGGVAAIMAKAGKDATAEWNGIHSKDAIEKICPNAVVGYLVASKEGGAEVPPGLAGA